MRRKINSDAGSTSQSAGDGLDPRYVGFFDRFNRQRFFEAHEILEELWLGERGGPRDRFFRGLIQLAGAFVHLQKGRLKPAASLFRLAQENLEAYPAVYERLSLHRVRHLIQECLVTLESSSWTRNPLSKAIHSRLALDLPTQ